MPTKTEGRSDEKIDEEVSKEFAAGLKPVFDTRLTQPVFSC